jgi:methylated-DNA-protein-cysteine methyltransferase-like protein
MKPQPESFGLRVARIVKSIPPGRVASYGQVARLAGNPRGARLVVRVLVAMSEKHGLPWHRVLSSQGRISLGGEGGSIQRQLLEQEGIRVGPGGEVPLEVYGWQPSDT